MAEEIRRETPPLAPTAEDRAMALEVAQLIHDDYTLQIGEPVSYQHIDALLACMEACITQALATARAEGRIDGITHATQGCAKCYSVGTGQHTCHAFAEGKREGKNEASLQVAKDVQEITGLVWDPPTMTLRGIVEALRAEGVAQERARLHAMVHQPNPTDPSRWDVAPGQHRAFSAYCREIAAALAQPKE